MSVISRSIETLVQASGGVPESILQCGCSQALRRSGKSGGSADR